MEKLEVLWEARVKEETEPKYLIDVCIKIEAEVDEDPNPKSECVQLEPKFVKPETLCRSGGLYVDHEVKEELVLGPELLQQLYADSSNATPHSQIAETSSDEKKHTKLQRHIMDRKHSQAIDIYMCDFCGKLFKLKHALIRHIKKHQENTTIPNRNKKLFSCEICNKQFSQSGHCNRHVSTHKGDKPYVCDVCNKWFAREDSLRVHARVHSGQQPYSCRSCGKRFSQSANLKRHVRVHTGERPYVCDVCDKSCSQSGDLKTHMRTHEVDNTPYSCDCCGRKFKKEAALNRHKRGHWRQKAKRMAS